MAYAKIVFQHPDTGLTKEAPVGYSWTVLLFGGYVPLVRFPNTANSILHVAWWISCGVGLGFLFNVIGSFMFNKQYISWLVGTKGYRAKYAVTIKGNTPIPIEHMETSLNLKLPKIDEPYPHDENDVREDHRSIDACNIERVRSCAKSSIGELPYLISEFHTSGYIRGCGNDRIPYDGKKLLAFITRGYCGTTRSLRCY